MAFDSIADYVIDNGLSVIDTQADAIFVCSAKPANFTEATVTYALGSKSFGAGNVCGVPVDSADGDKRQVATNAFNDGVISASGTAVAWAIVDTVNSRLLANGPLASTLVNSGRSFGLPVFNVILPQVGL